MTLLPLLASSDPVGHVVDKAHLAVGHDIPWFLSSDGRLWLLSNVSIMLVAAAAVTALIVIPAARRITTGKTGSIDDLRAKGLLANLIESVCLYLREQVFRPVLQDQTDKYAPVLWTFFFFILICNLMGLIPLKDATEGIFHALHLPLYPIGGTATQSIWVTGALATVAFFFVNGTAFVKDPAGFCKHLTAGAPWFMWPIMIPVEIMGMFVKPVALALRLFANMTGGHIIIAVLLSFVVGLTTGLGGVGGYSLSLIPLAGSVAINMLEIMVAFIQAFIFTFLTCLFLGQLVVHEHEHGEHDEHGESEHGHGHEHAHGHGKPAAAH